MNDESCYSCGKQYPNDDTVYFRICGECFHAWKTEDDLIQHDYKERCRYNKIQERRSVKAIYSCPCCVHDF